MIKISCYFTASVEFKRSGRTVFCIVDNTVVSKTKPSSQALYPIKITYFLYDSLYNSEKIINVFVKKRISYNWRFKNKSDYLSLWSEKETLRICNHINRKHLDFDFVLVKNQ